MSPKHDCERTGDVFTCELCLILIPNSSRKHEDALGKTQKMRQSCQNLAQNIKMTWQDCR